MLLFFKSAIILLILLLPFVFIHELGHATYCTYEGYDFDIGFSAMGGYTICYGEIDDNFRYAAIGGATSAIIAGIVSLFVWRWKPLWIAVSTIAILQFINMIVESVFYEQYMSYDSFIPSMFGLMMFLVIIVITTIVKRRERYAYNESY